MQRSTFHASLRGATTLCAALFLGLLLATAALAQGPSTDPDYQQFMEDGGDWLLPLQQPDGSFPWTSDDPGSIFINVQAPIGQALIAAWQVTDRADFLDAAVDVGDYLLANQAEFPDGNPVFRSYDAYFLTRLADATGDSTYSDHLQNFFWDRIEAGTYGPDADWDIVDYVAAEIDRRGDNPATREVVAAWDLALVAVAADESGIDQFDDELMDGVRLALETSPDIDYELGSSGYDVLGLTGAVWAGAITGQSAVPSDGLWAGLADNQALANALLGYQAAPGSFLQSTLANSDPIDPEQTVSQTTAFALLGLAELGGSQYFDELTAALESMILFQESDGRILYYHPDVDLSTVPSSGDVLEHAYALQAFADVQGVSEPFSIPALGFPGLLILALSLTWLAARSRTAA